MEFRIDKQHRLHLGFVDPADNKPYDFMLENEDTERLALFLYPRACSKISREKLAITTQFFCAKNERDKLRSELEKELTDGSTPSSGTTENEQGKG